MAVTLITTINHAASASVLLSPIVSDHAVLQRSTATRIFGTAAPGQGITIEFAGLRAATSADPTGKWSVLLDLSKAATGPHTLSATGANGDKVSASDVLIGEVWLCSGQSNMEWILTNANHAKEEIAAADYPEMRQFLVPKNTGESPTDVLHGTWVVCSPKTAGGFTAVGYFFGRELLTTQKFPVGLIHSSWGGTVAEAWTSDQRLQADPDLKYLIDNRQAALKTSDPALVAYKKALAEWEVKNFSQDPGIADHAKGWELPATPTTDWKTMDLPCVWESNDLSMDGALWYRRDIDLPATSAGLPATLSLGPIDDFDITFVNGQQVGVTDGAHENAYQIPRSYKLPAGLLKPGKNTIAIRVWDRAGDGGVCGAPQQMALEFTDKPSIPLAGPWSYKIELQLPNKGAEIFATMPHSPGGEKQNLAAMLYNAMIQPLTPVTVAGAIWYQGESNVGRAYQYRHLFREMILDWRARFGQPDMPFLFVQLANFQPRHEQPGDSAWAELRDAQDATLQLPNTGMATAIDLGEANDIHPRNKQDVGKRLALAALKMVYGKDVEFSGPRIKAASSEGSSLRLTFTHADGLVVKGDLAHAFAIAGDNGEYHWADAKIDGSSILLSSPQVPQPKTVRYGWADNPSMPIYNNAGLPAVPFRTDTTPYTTLNNK